jgi:hypothetical protein
MTMVAWSVVTEAAWMTGSFPWARAGDGPASSAPARTRMTGILTRSPLLPYNAKKPVMSYHRLAEKRRSGGAKNSSFAIRHSQLAIDSEAPYTPWP